MDTVVEFMLIMSSYSTCSLILCPPSCLGDASPVAVLPVLQKSHLGKNASPVQAVAEHVSNLATMAGDLLEEQTFGDTSSDFRQGVRRATWVGPAWMTAPYREQVRLRTPIACSHS